MSPFQPTTLSKYLFCFPYAGITTKSNESNRVSFNDLLVAQVQNTDDTEALLFRMLIPYADESEWIHDNRDRDLNKLFTYAFSLQVLPRTHFNTVYAQCFAYFFPSLIKCSWKTLLRKTLIDNGAIAIYQYSTQREK